MTKTQADDGWTNLLGLAVLVIIGATLYAFVGVESGAALIDAPPAHRFSAIAHLPR